MFKLMRPCATCPFRKGQGEMFGLRQGRLLDIKTAPAFQCHKTVDYSGDDRRARAGDKPNQCAGLMAVLHREDQPSQIMQVATRLGTLDPTKLDPDGEAYSCWADVEAAHAGRPR